MANTGLSAVGHLGWCHRGMLSPDLWACYSYSGGVAGPASKHHHADQMCVKFTDQAEALLVVTGQWKLSPLFSKTEQSLKTRSCLSPSALLTKILHCSHEPSSATGWWHMCRFRDRWLCQPTILHHSFHKTNLIHLTVSTYFFNCLKSFGPF